MNGYDPAEAVKRPKFETLTPIFPTKRLTLETTRQQLATRLIDLIAPIGKGQRGLIAAPPKAGKTTLLKNIANAIESKYDDIDLFALQLSKSKKCPAGPKSARVRTFAETLVENDGPAVSMMAKLFGAETMRRIVLKHMYGVG